MQYGQVYGIWLAKPPSGLIPTPVQYIYESLRKEVVKDVRGELTSVGVSVFICICSYVVVGYAIINCN